MQKSKWLLGLVVATAVGSLAACGSPEEEPKAQETSASAKQEAGSDASGQGQDQGQEGKPDTKGIPDVVAEVNGEKITKKDFVPLYETQYQQMQMQSQQSGQQVDEKQLKTQTAENLVSTELLSQEADKRGIKVSDKDVDKGLEESAKSSQMSKKDFLAAMKKQGMDEKKVHSELKTQLSIEGLIKDEYGEFKASGEEIGQAYEQAKSQQEQMAQQGGQQAQEVPPLEEMRPQLEEQVKSQKSTEATQKYAKKLRKQGDVKVNL
ncbi:MULTISPECIES: SurA N-terminal domain-containing protein [unclassified Brevibacterium]|uniref:SurA N-terminal domain-containing protein n=1 Tax=unclassified Brevibacterium TaxID=2614124 RepID=UPI000C63A9F8|nr:MULTISPECIES: SurA N-terminal domain-containing protein [unclassified Brevibacterium]SMX71543.1 SurA N-terminal domain-containing protein [Brevibacterium sp. 239c]